MTLLNPNPLVSVIMSVKDDEDNIFNAVKSILSQTYQNIELLVVDDYSSDSTYEILKSIDSDKLKVFRNKENIGLTKSLNFLIKKTNGEYIARQDSDDLSFKNRIESQLEIIHNNSIDLVCSRAIVKDSNRIIPGISFYLPLNFILKIKNPIIHGTILIKKSTLVDIGSYDEEFKYAQDYRLILNLQRNKYKIFQMNEVLYQLNMENNISSNFKSEQAVFAKRARKKD